MEADVLPSEYDAVVLGTGVPESVLAAALSRIGYKVLHLDRNEYYGGCWATFNLDSLLKWIERKQNGASSEPLEEHATTDYDESKEYLIQLSTSSYSAISHVECKSFLRDEVIEVQRSKESCVPDDSSQVNIKGESPASIDKDTENTAEKVESGDEFTRVGDVDDREPKNDINQAVDDIKDNNDVQSTETVIETKECHKEPDCKDEVKTEDEVYNRLSNEADQSTQSVTTEGVIHRRKPKSEDNASVEDLPSPSNVTGPYRRRKTTEEKFSLKSTLKDLQSKWRQFNIDLAPRFLFSRGTLVDTLISANITHYCEFKPVTRILTMMNDQLEEVPCSRADVFSCKLINVIEKRSLMKFLTFCLNYDQNPEEFSEYKDKPYKEFLQSRRLTNNLQHFVVHAIAMVTESTPTLEGLKATQYFLRSLGRYGNTPFIWPLYGAGEIPQAFCRMSAVFGGVYCLRRSAQCAIIDKETNKCSAVMCTNGQRLVCKWLITERTFLMDENVTENNRFISRAIFITNQSLKTSEDDITLVSVPPLPGKQEPVHVIELGHTSMACPKGLYIVHLTCVSMGTACEDLKPVAEQLFHFPGSGSNESTEKPTVLWCMYFTQANPSPPLSKGLPDNVLTLGLPGSELGFDQAMQQAKAAFEVICPGEDFLPAVPNPEDIIWDDNSNQPETVAAQSNEETTNAVQPEESNSSEVNSITDAQPEDSAQTEVTGDELQAEESSCIGTEDVQKEDISTSAKTNKLSTDEEQAEESSNITTEDISTSAKTNKVSTDEEQDEESSKITTEDISTSAKTNKLSTDEVHVKETSGITTDTQTGEGEQLTQTK